MTSRTKSYAEIELDILVKSASDPENRPIIEEFIPEILALCDKFGNSGQSGGSAPYTANALSSAIKKLCLQKPICPIMGIDEEWNDVSIISDEPLRTLYQNKRCSALFKDNDNVYYLDAIVWQGDTEGESGNNWDTFTGTVEGIKSRQYIKGFPFEPKTFYIDVTREMLPEDWDEEPFYEDKSYYDTKEFEETGIKNWKKGDKYRYIIKDKKQLDDVFAYYDKRKDQVMI